MEAFRHSYAEYGHWIILIKGVTPIPYKLVTIASGFAGYSLFWFVVLSVITRGIRFAMLAGAMHYFAEPIRRIMERHFGLVMGLVLGFVVVGFGLAKLAF
jgi:membrane protein YqaA with SNARE-associated domain